MSAGLIPALVAVVLLALSGCGGGGSDESTAASAQGGGAKAGETSSTEAEAQGGGGAKPGEGAQGPSGSAAPSQGAGKQGTQIKAPKGAREPGPTQAQKEQATVNDISLASPSLESTGGEPVLPATYTCDGKDSWPELRWGGVPTGTKELVLFAMNIQPVEEKLFFDWALAGIDPNLKAIEAGKLPKGAVLGQNGFRKSGYSICPPKGSGETYVFALYALPEALTPSSGFDPRSLREEVLATSGNVGLVAARYERG
jgi:phosphatidylethanolamine-binding protein (PEBP) family uncharacterized protein